ncbi:MAG: DUF1461 domain-containing protein [Nanoarchaeota archaeon]|nr:DUF1461 domain-containing protein [Nanoarchaeota archaeon]
MGKKKKIKTKTSKKRKRKFERPAWVLAAIIFASVLLITPFELMLYFRPLYQIQFDSLGVYDKLGKEKADSMLWDVLEFMDGQTDRIEDFSDKEILHMIDVRDILEKIIWIFFLFKIFQIFLWFYLTSMNKIMSSVYYAGLIGVCVIGIFLILSTCCFNFMFSGFHEIFFSQGNYTFDPDFSLMKTMFPDKFFRNFAIINAIFSLLISLGAMLVGHLYFKYVAVSTRK